MSANSSESINAAFDHYYQPDEVIDLFDDNSSNSCFKTLKSVNADHESIQQQRFSKARRNSSSDIDALLSELSSKYCPKENTSKHNLNPDVSKHSSKPVNVKNIRITTIVTLSDSEESDDQNESQKLFSFINVKTPESKHITNLVSDSEDEIEVLKSAKPNIIKQNKKALQDEKRIHRELKKAEVLKAKEIKKLINQANKNLKPDEYLKQIEVIYDESLSDKPLAKEMFNLLNANDIKFSKTSQIYPNIITWKRTLQSHQIEGDKLINNINSEDCNTILFILECDDFIAMIEKDELIEYFKTVQEIMPGKIITLGLYGITDYLRVSKNQKRRNFKNSVLGTKSNENNFAMFDKNAIESKLTKLQFFLSICYKYLDTAHDVAALVNHFTKSIAQIPYKLKKQDKMEQSTNYMIGDNKDCVVVDKNGNGLSRLWQQNITAFPLARLDLAESIISTYPTFNSLMQAYEKCTDDRAGEKLVEGLEIRRAAGPLTNFRKVGPEFSKKMFKYYNSRDPHLLL